jgi:hypothetical protein
MRIGRGRSRSATRNPKEYDNESSGSNGRNGQGNDGQTNQSVEEIRRQVAGYKNGQGGNNNNNNNNNGGGGGNRRGRSVDPKMPTQRDVDLGYYSQDDDVSAMSGRSNSNRQGMFSTFGNKRKKEADINDEPPPPEILKRVSSQKFQSLAAVSDIEKLAQKKGANPLNERFKVMPDDAYPNTMFNREELRTEMNKKSAYFHDLRVPTKKGSELGQLRLEILQCFGIPTSSVIRETPAYCVAVCGSNAFKTDVMPPVANPIWLCKMRRACLFPIFHAYARLYLGVFDNSAEGSNSDFAGRIVIDIARLRAGCTYDITLPLRVSSHIFSREQRGAIRIRVHLIWSSERSAIMSYIPKTKPKFGVNDSITVNCLDDRSFRNVAHVVHGTHMPGRFSMTLLKSTIREINFTRVHVMRYIRKRELYYLINWQYPFISGFVFIAWMHSIYANSVRYVPGHVITFLLLHLWKNYVYYCMNSSLQNGFMAPTFEELFNALLRGSRRRRYIEPLNMEMDESHTINPLEHMETHDDYEEFNTDFVPISEIAESMRKSIRTANHTYRLRTFKNCFTGVDAVDFLVSFGFAGSREEAVELGRKLEKETKLFEHVARTQKFDDKPYFYSFLDYDAKTYVIKGHTPMGTQFFKMIGFLKDGIVSEQDEHVEFPFATGLDHPRFTVKQSLVIRSADAKKLLKKQKLEQDVNDCAEFGVAPAKLQSVDDSSDRGEERIGFRRASMGMKSMTARSTDTVDAYDDMASQQNASVDGDGLEQRNANVYDKYENDSDEDVDEVKKNTSKGIIIEEKTLKKPPNQDINVKGGGGDKAFGKVLQEARHKVHGVLLHLFNDRVYKIDEKLYSPALPKDAMPASVNIAPKKKVMKGLAKAIIPGSQLISKKKKKEKKQTTPYDAKADDYDKMLGINKYSHGNPWINRVAVIVQPIVEIVQEWLCLVRALFNIFTWQDPILSFWFAFLGPIVVLILHFAPWRIFLAIIGVCMVGPQNWLMRMLRERRADYEPPDFDKIIKKKKVEKEAKYEEVPYFSSESPGNRLLFFKNVDPMQVKKIVVPYGQLKYQR